MVIAFVPARGNSKSIPLKNIKPFCGKPLIYWNLIALENAEKVDKVIVATDSDKISEIVNSFKFTKINIYNRNSENAQDTSSTESVMLEYLSTVNYDNNTTFMLVQVTSPFTKADDFDNAIKLYEKNIFDSMLSAIHFKRFLWGQSGKPINYNYRDRPRRQNFDGCYLENGAFYINKIKNIIKYKNRLSGKIGIFEMPPYTEYEIDEPSDWIICEEIMKKHNLNKKDNKLNIKLFITDVDGVLTDAGMYYSNSGDELKKFNTHDGMGIKLLRDNKIKTAIITSESTEIIKKRGDKLRIDYIYQGVKDKLAIAKEICLANDINLNETAFIGDDINDLELLKAVGVKACPDNATDSIKAVPGIIHLMRKGGEGAVRELIDFIIINHKEE